MVKQIRSNLFDISPKIILIQIIYIYIYIYISGEMVDFGESEKMIKKWKKWLNQTL